MHPDILKYEDVELTDFPRPSSMPIAFLTEFTKLYKLENQFKYKSPGLKAKNLINSQQILDTFN